jgi:molecular chaperone DnaK
MMKEAESHADEDRKRKEEIETRNQADQAAYAAERMLKDAGEKVSATDRAAIESAINDLKQAIEQNDIAGMKKRMEALNTAQHKAAEAMYRASGAGAGQAGGGAAGEPSQQPGGNGRASSDVIDAEVVEEEKR